MFGLNSFGKIGALVRSAFAQVFSPLSLFASGEQGFVYDPKTAEIYQDSGKTTLATTTGDKVGYVQETSGHNYHALQSVSGSRPSLVVDEGSRVALRSTGSFYLSASNVDFSLSSKVTSIIAFKPSIFDTGQQAVFSHGDNPFGTGGFSNEINQEVSSVVGSTFGQGSGNYRFMHSGVVTESKDIVVTMQFDPAGATDGEKYKIWINGVLSSTSTWLTSGAISSAMFAVRNLYLLSRGGVGGFLIGDLYFALCVGRELSTQERINAESFARLRATVVPTYSIKSYSMSRNSVLNPTYAYGSSLSKLEWSTTATSVDVNYVSTIRPVYSTFSFISTYIDGVFYSETACPADAGTLTISLPAGGKTVQLLNGGQTFYNNGIIGTWITGASFNASATKLAEEKGGIVVYGDSIAIGQLASPVSQYGWTLQVRSALPDKKLSVEGWGTRSLYDDVRSTYFLSQFVQYISEYSPNTIWLAIGTNDYGLNKWSASAFGTAYSALLDALHVALPSAIIYAQTPLPRTTETANGSGSTLGDYRSQIATCVSTRTSYTTLVDGTAIMTTASLGDGVHPNTAGHTLYANYVKTILGI